MGSYLFLAVRALATVVIAASLWPWIADGYDALVIKAAGVFLPEGLTARAASGRIFLEFPETSKGEGLFIHGFTLHFGLILVLALVASTPSMSPVKMLGWAGGAIALFFVAHAIGLSLLMRGVLSAWQGGGSVGDAGGMMTAFAIFWALLPALVGGAWCYRYWLPGLRAAGRSSSKVTGESPKGGQS